MFPSFQLLACPVVHFDSKSLIIYVPHRSGAMQWSPFWDWFISLSIIPPGCICDVTNGSTYFFKGRQVLHCIPRARFLSSHLSIDIQVTSLSWLLWIMQRWTWVCRYTPASLVSILNIYTYAYIYIYVLDYKVVLFLIL